MLMTPPRAYHRHGSSAASVTPNETCPFGPCASSRRVRARPLGLVNEPLYEGVSRSQPPDSHQHGIPSTGQELGK